MTEVVLPDIKVNTRQHMQAFLRAINTAFGSRCQENLRINGLLGFCVSAKSKCCPVGSASQSYRNWPDKYWGFHYRRVTNHHLYATARTRCSGSNLEAIRNLFSTKCSHLGGPSHIEKQYYHQLARSRQRGAKRSVLWTGFYLVPTYNGSLTRAVRSLPSVRLRSFSLWPGNQDRH